VWDVGLVGVHSDRFRRVTLTAQDLEALTLQTTLPTYAGDGHLLRLGMQAYALGIAHEFDPYFGLSISRVDPLPHQLEAVYDHLLKLARVRFLLANDAGAGKTIMAGLLIRELKLWGLVERILIVCPANLSFQWQRELKDKFDETFLVLKGADIRDQFGVNQWLEHKQGLTSLDLAKRDEILAGLRQVHWDLAIVDEAHCLSWMPPARKTARYALGEGAPLSWRPSADAVAGKLLRARADHLLLLTATPHFSLFLQLLDRDAYADVCSIRQAMEQGRAPCYLQRTKEAMVHFPERQPDGTWVARKIFTRRIPHTVGFQIDGPEFALYQDITRFVKRQSAMAAAQGDDPRARAVGFLMALYQRRLASSTYAVRQSLENRARRLVDGLQRAQALARQALPTLPDPDELEEMEEVERDRLERILEAITLAGNAEQAREESAELRRLAQQARRVEAAGAEAKLARLKELPHTEGFFDRPEQRLLLFTEAPVPDALPPVATRPETTAWLHVHALTPFLEEVRAERAAETAHIAAHVELSLTELLQKADDEIGRAAAEIEQGVQGAEGRLAQAEARHADLLHRRERRRQDLQHQRAVSRQGVERLATALLLPHPAREAPEVQRLRPNAATEALAMQVVMEHERAQGCQVFDVHERNLGYDLTSLDLQSGKLRLIEVKGLGAATGTILLTPNERRVAEDRRDCYWLYVVTNCQATPQFQPPIQDPARFPWHEVSQVQHYWLAVDALTQPMQVREEAQRYGDQEDGWENDRSERG
jgi:hypothetical protein